MSFAAASLDILPNGESPNGLRLLVLVEPAIAFTAVEEPNEPNDCSIVPAGFGDGVLNNPPPN